MLRALGTFLAAATMPFCVVFPAQAANVTALWVYSGSPLPNPVTDKAARKTLIRNASASGVNLLYVSVYNGMPNAAGRMMYDDSFIADLIRRAHQRRIEVYAALGDTEWPAAACAPSGTPYKRFADIAGYDSAEPGAKFDGIVLDVEPRGDPDFTALLNLYRCFQEQARAAGLGLSVAINAFWDTPVTFGGATREAYKHIVDLKLNHVVVMGYRNTAGTLGCAGSAGLICLDEKIVAYANSVALGETILVGLSSDNPGASHAEDRETFYFMGQAAMNEAVQSVTQQFGAAGQRFGGFAIHSYRNAYLSGQLSGWPSTNGRRRSWFARLRGAR